MPYESINSRVVVFASEKQMEDALNGATLPANWGVKSKGGKFVWAQDDTIGKIISAEAQAVLDRMTGLTATEEDAIITFVNAESASLGNGNWAFIDEFFSFSLNATDRLTGFIAKTATNNGATFDINGATFAGAENISTNFNPSVDGVNYVLNNSMSGVFLKEFTDLVSDIQDILNGNALRIRLQAALGRYRGKINSGTDVNLSSAVPSQDQLVIFSRDNAADFDVIIDGTPIQTVANASTGLNAAAVSIGVNFIGTISTFIIGASIGFDQANHNTNHRQFLTDLGVL